MAVPKRQHLNALILEDNPGDAALLVIELEQAGFEVKWQRVDTEGAYSAALDNKLDIILSDFNLPTLDAARAIEVLMAATDLDVPLIVVSGTMDEDTAVRMLRSGAADFLFKNDLARLGDAVRGALEEREVRAERRVPNKLSSANRA